MSGAVQASKMQTEALDSPNSPFFVNFSNNQGAIVTYELTEGNYCSWRHSFELALSIKNKLGFVDGSLPQPPVEDPLYPAWRRCNNLTKSWIQRSVSMSIASTIFFLDTAKEIWEELKERYADPDDSRVCQLQYEYHSLVQGSRTVSAFYNDMLSILRELRIYRPLSYCECGKCDCGWLKEYSEQCQKDMIFKFLNGLNDSFSALRTQILLRKHFPNLGEAYNMVQREEIQRNTRGNDTNQEDTMMMAATVMTSVKQKATGVEGLPANAAFVSRKGRFDLICEHCGRKGYLKEKCYHLNGFPPNSRFGRGKFRPQSQ